MSAVQLAQYPCARVFTAKGAVQVHLIRSNGVNMLCATPQGQLALVRMRDVLKVSECNSDSGRISRIDSTNGHFYSRESNYTTEADYGPVRRGAQPTPQVNLAELAAELGHNIGEVPDLLGLPLEADADGAVCLEGPPQPVVIPDTYEGLVKALGGLSSLEDLQPPRLPE